MSYTYSEIFAQDAANGINRSSKGMGYMCPIIFANCTTSCGAWKKAKISHIKEGPDGWAVINGYCVHPTILQIEKNKCSNTPLEEAHIL